ncbi:MAG: hypothetical protein H6551_12750 [Chitinophagales bacterium]|nr:hypothetical protein [Chitinophagaceae bacterium]MCB9066001.1 hypothetical protein [Chitinophagales bacterium]
MQTTSTYYAHNTQAEQTTTTAKAHIRKEAFQKILLFAGILACIALAVNI